MFPRLNRSKVLYTGTLRGQVPDSVNRIEQIAQNRTGGVSSEEYFRIGYTRHHNRVYPMVFLVNQGGELKGGHRTFREHARLYPRIVHCIPAFANLFFVGVQV